MKLAKNKIFYLISFVCLLLVSIYVFAACGNKDNQQLNIQGIEIDFALSNSYCLQNEKPTLYYIKVYDNNTKSAPIVVPNENIEITSDNLGNNTAKINLHNHKVETTIFVYNKIIKNNENAELILENLQDGDNLAIVKSDININKISTNSTNNNAHLLISKNNLTIYGFESSLRPKSNLVLPNFIEITGNNVTINKLNLYPHASHENAILVNGVAGGRNVLLSNLTLSPNIYPYTINYAGTINFVGNIGNSLLTHCTLNKARVNVSLASGDIILKNTTFNFDQVAGNYLALFPFYKGTNFTNITLSGDKNFVVADTRLQAYVAGGPDESFIINFDPIDWDMGAFVEYIYE